VIPLRTPNFKLLGAVVVLLAAAQHAAAEDMSAPRLTSYQLDNGLEVILAPDHKVPKVSMNLYYRVGSLNEPAGRSGFAHLFEHLMLLSGTPAYPRATDTFIDAGISFNAFTLEDGTTYLADGMASTLPLMLSVYADQMANLGPAVDQADLDLQRSVVLNEMRQNVLDSPAMSAVTALRSAMFPRGHPYSRAPIGSIPDLQAATLDDVRSFFNAYYAPNNAVLVIVGDFEIAEARALIDDTFGRIPRGPDAEQPTPDAFEATRTRIEATDALATPLIYFAFNGPDAKSDANAALFMAADLLSNEAGLLRKKLVNTGLATYAGGAWFPGKLGGRFFVYASASPNVSAEQIEAALRQVIAEFAAAPLNAADLERTRSALLLSIRSQLEAFPTRSAYIASTKAIKDDITHVLEDHPDIVAATVADVEAAVDRVLSLDAASVAVVRPGARGDYPPVLTEVSGELEPIVAPQRPGVAIPVLAAGDSRAATLPDRQTATLTSGIQVVHYRMEGAPLAYISAAVSGGLNNDPPGKEGLYELAAETAWRGAGGRSLEDFGRALRDIGGGLASGAGSLMSGATLSVQPDQIAVGVDLLADVLQKPNFAPGEWETVKAATLNGLIERDSDPTSVARRALNQVVFFPGADDSGVAMTLASVSSITLEEAATAFEEMVTPKTMVIHSVGDLPLEAVVAALEPRFGRSWVDDDAGLASKPSLPVVFPTERQVYLVPVPGTSQATIYIARAAPGTDDPTYPNAVAVANLLAGDFSSRLNSVIREQKGYSYGVSGALWDWYQDDSALTVTIPVQIDATGPALAEVFRGFDSLVAHPVTDAEVTRSVNAYNTVLASLPETASAFFTAIVGMHYEGIDLDKSLAHAQRMTELELDEVQAEAMKLAMLDRAVIIIAGDPGLILPQLDAMGITEVGTIVMPNAAAALPAGAPGL
jgi:zinc protease